MFPHQRQVWQTATFGRRVYINIVFTILVLGSIPLWDGLGFGLHSTKLI